MGEISPGGATEEHHGPWARFNGSGKVSRSDTGSLGLYAPTGLLSSLRTMMTLPGTKQTCEFDSSDEEPVEGERTPFHISWLDPSPVHYPQFLGLCSLPGCRFKDVGRNLQKDLGEPKSCGARDLFVFCTRGELASCYGGLGRSCLVAACLLLRLSDTGAIQEVIDGLRNPRGSGAIQTRKMREPRPRKAKGLARGQPGRNICDCEPLSGIVSV
ncbi:cyclin-dependent kinase inhibitor 3 [Ornithorhynchus anatinus]|uniref:cyclin-dependent kinase inhibitor 3 n=1 Tax=Ornithorhynchus anatinus TaxID=9258 RepID=UPI0019D430DB|nr:cyclin-dependent kinase inhibitor 3 [Ornithorhynchus anatinus]